MIEKIIAPLSGKVISIHIEPGTQVEEDDEILVIEAMKMETTVYAPCAGRVAEVPVKVGADVEEDDALVLIETA